MSDWNFSGAFWGTPANWTGGVPDGVGVSATIDASGFSGTGTHLVVFEDASAYLVGHLTLTTSTRTIALQGGASTTSAELNFFAGTGEPAVIEADSNGTSNLLFINGDNGLQLSVYDVRRQNIWRNLQRKLAECGPRLGVDVRRLACGVASADVR